MMNIILQKGLRFFKIDEGKLVVVAGSGDLLIKGTIVSLVWVCL